MKALVLLSGGMDSTALVNYYLSLNYETYGIFIDYGQKSREQEKRSAISIAKHFNIKLFEIESRFNVKYDQGEIVGRNAFLVICALMDNPFAVGIIGIGIHKGTSYYDCSQTFLGEINRLILGYCSGRVILDAPFIEMSKNEIFQYCIENRIPIDLTYSCQNGVDPPCGACPSCKDILSLKKGNF